MIISWIFYFSNPNNLLKLPKLLYFPNLFSYSMKMKVLFICSSNQARSQMAEGLLRDIYGDRYEVFSAGVNPTFVAPEAIIALDEVGIDITHHTSQSVEEYRDVEFEYVITVCDKAKETCPFFPGAKNYIHKSFREPSRACEADEPLLNGYRRVRDDISKWIEKTFETPPEGHPQLEM
jgi:arsenate reductase